MKKLNFVLVVLVVFVLAVSAEEWINFNERGESAPIYDLTNSTNSLVEFELEIPGMSSRDVNDFNRVNIPEHAIMDSVGFPEVPIVTYLIAIPECDNVNLNITLSDSTIIENINIYPAPELVEITNNGYTYLEEQFTINSSFYNRNEYFPQVRAELVEKGAVRDQHCIRIKVYPVQFNPVLQQVVAYSHLNIEMTFDNVIGSVNKDVGIFNEICGNTMINYNSNGMNASISCGAGYRDPGSVTWLTDLNSLFMGYSGVHCDYLIITHQEFWENTDLQTLADKRDEYNGFDVVIVKTEDFFTPGGYHDVELKDIIRNTYNNGYADNTFDNKLGYINLFGDVDLESGAQYPVPTHDNGYDVYFSQLTETSGIPDIYPDVLLGRCPVDSEEQVANVCQKIVDYEPIDIGATGYDVWKDRMTFLLGEPSDGNIQYNVELIDPIVESFNTTLLTEASYPFSQTNFDNILMDNSESIALDKFAEGNLIYTYMGHGGYNCWAWPEETWQYHFYYNYIDDPENPNQQQYEQFDNRLPLIFSIACNTGGFQNNDNCMAEKFLLSNSIRGAIGFIGATEPSSYNSDCGFVTNLFQAFCSHDLSMCGEILLEAKLKASAVNKYNLMNLFGDPALNILLDSENIEIGDLQCSSQQINTEVINNQTLHVSAGVSNLSYANISGNIVVECQLTNNLTGNSQTNVYVMSSISAMETKGATFNFNISDCMPTEFDILITVDPNNLITERNEENNEAETGYDYYRFQDNFPVIINMVEGSFLSDDAPLYHNNNIILGGKKISSSGQLLWDCNLRAEGLSLPIKTNETDFDYIVREKTLSDSRLYRIDGNTGNCQFYYSVDPNESGFYNYCLGDLNNDGINELICKYVTTPQVQWYLAIFGLDGTVLTNFDCGQFKDIAIGDGNNDGKNELYILTDNDLTSYDYNNGTLTQINQITSASYFNKSFALEDFNNDGELDCVIFSGNVISFLTCSDFLMFDEVNLTSSFKYAALGDIDNDGNTEIVISQTGDTYDETDIYRIDILETEYEFLFTEEINSSDSKLSLCDLNSDNNLDIVLGDERLLNGYLSDGDLIFSLPNNMTKTYSVITDLDSDSDIEIIFAEEAPDFGQYTNYKVSVSDLNITVGNSGNVYPKMNEYNNNLYSQPVSGILLENTDYIWDGSITLHGEVSLPVSSTLTIQPGTIIKTKENSKLTCYGEFTVNGTENHPVTFEPVIQGASQNFWQGLEFPVGIIDSELNHVVIQGGEINSYRELSIINGSLINTPLNIDSSNLYLDNSTLENSPITAELYGLTSQTDIISIQNSAIKNIVSSSSVEITGYPNINITNNLIEGCYSGIKIWESGSGAISTISNNIIQNNQNDGIYLYHSNIDILGNNRVENNGRDGLFIIRDSNFNLIGSENYPLQIIRDNNENEVRFTYDSRPAQFYYNKIYDENHEYSYVKCERVPVFNEPINISNNNWGTSFNPNTDLSPFELFEYLPMWDPGVPRNPDTSEDETMYLTAKQSIDNADYSIAEQTLKQLITIYPASKFAGIAAKELFDLKVKSDQDFAGLKFYYETESNMHFNEEMTKLSEYLISCCNVKLEEFQPAIDYHENIIQNPPSTVDSVFAVIDAGYTYLVMENASRANYTGSIMELKPKSKKEFEEKRDDLINMLFGNSEPDNEIPEVNKLALYSNYPNPFNPSTTISFSIPEESKVEVSVFNIKGQVVKTLVKDVFESGKHSVIWRGKDNNNKKCSSGIYFYQLNVNGKPKSVKKCLLLK
ncbi:MAG: FG-GAP-like repeat-containing protein [Melioribacteraceae bacterium]|nr:FG-GAP-like repeat-containing protein [Melioribacteraceae bacterium]